MPWTPAGFALLDAVRPGQHPYHAAGLFYVQDPSAMAVAEFLRVEPGHTVLDIAASPGGKSTHLLSLLSGRGLLVSNDTVRNRIPPLLQNLERWGATNAIVTSLDADDLARRSPQQFDRVIVDAPCSGEGLFRKQRSARDEWSLEHVAGCAIRQTRLLESAAATVKPGGLLLYATCTFSPEENELQVDRFLDSHPGWQLLPLPQTNAIAPGRPDWIASRRSELTGLARFWPHRTVGEGHTMALLQAPEGPSVSGLVMAKQLHSSRSSLTEPDPEGYWRQFRSDLLPGFDLEGTLIREGNRLLLLPAMSPEIAQLPAIHRGLWLGSLLKNRFEPSHALALATHAPAARNRIDLSQEEILSYLRGEPLASAGQSGWTLVSVDGHSLGWGKRSGDIVKNHYPRGLRWFASSREKP